MFTGIVEHLGEVVKVEDGVLWVSSPVLAGAAKGASVAVDGVCLTVTEREADLCRFDLSGETLERSTLGERRPGDAVNLERPLRAGDELGGHIVQGHVDGIGRVTAVAPEGAGTRMTVAVAAELLRYVVEKGSVTVDGVALTVTAVTAAGFEVALIPHTLAVTSLGDAEAGRRVNIEVDVLARYVEKLVAPVAMPDNR
jgi:riboflavin synthase